MSASRRRASVPVPAGMETVIVSGVSSVSDSGTRTQVPPSTLPIAERATLPPAIAGGYRPEASYHPLQASGTSAAGGVQPSQAGPYAIPPGQTLADVASGTQAQPFDVTLSQLATAVYGTRGAPPEGWNAVSDKQL